MVYLLWKTAFYIAPLITLVSTQHGKPEIEFPLMTDATLENLKAGLEAGWWTSANLVETYGVRHVETHNYLRAISEWSRNASNTARALDRERKAGKIRGPLHGIPILIKNNIATSDFLQNTAGSTILKNTFVSRDATVIAKLRAAGAIILGKSNLSQWANFRSSNSSNGWSAHGGQVQGVYYPEQDPCGSSSGSGVATTAGLAWASLGTETDGSIICPASWSNIVGIKPTVGLTSRDLVIPISERQDTVGPMARTVKDAAYLLQAIAGPDPNDNYTSAIPFPAGKLPDYVKACKKSALKGARIGVPHHAISPSTSPQVLAYFNAALWVLADAGATVVDNVNYTGWQSYVSDAGASESKVLSADFVANLASYLKKLVQNPLNLTSLEDVRRYTREQEEEEYPDRDTASFDEAIELSSRVKNTDKEVWDAYQRNLYFGGEGGLLGALDKYNLDAVVLPSNTASGISAIIGGPVITVPLGAYSLNTTVKYNRRGNLVEVGPGVPFGMAFAGKLWSEEKLIGLAYAFEQRTKVRGKVKALFGPMTELEDIVEGKRNGTAVEILTRGV
ncbi:glutamyl-tRNA amidotransferase subunit A [Dendryphion nanum]|uniref:Glutamyl-tRNA amidotransferase subunit A n=1 Tax=Dendryphion nanum TaxID=256645 RepID=A0A9P9I681_9PLEO|nr:glutamyl-tRNA amidotransferase subunit A [Dendryphion nanum]